MKNLHMIPTDKPSRLLKTMPKGNLILSKSITSGSHWENQHIYIISDEEIRGYGEIVFDIKNNKVVKWEHPIATTTPYFKKIILTTDQDLINDGVQAIDNEFLEWFVKNPSCEEVEVDLVPVNEFGSEITVNGYGFDKFKYKIIIPKEEPKQETIEEAAENRFGTDMDSIRGSNVYDLNTDLKKGFIAGAKWQAERMYSEEKVLELLNGYNNHIQENFDPSKTILSTKEWFEQFKKK